MSHRNARLTPHGRLLLVQRILDQGWPVAHAAKAQGVSRQCAHRWKTRYLAEGPAGLSDRSSRPHTQPTRTSPEAEQAVLEHRHTHRRGPAIIAAATGTPARTITRILRRHDEPLLSQLDPMTGTLIRASKTTTIRYERTRPGELVHIDVKKLGKIPDGGGWKALGRAATQPAKGRRPGVGYDYIHSAVDDYTRLAYSEIHDDDTATTCATFLTHAADFFASHGITIERVLTDNALSYRNSRAFADTLTTLGATHKFIRPHCPWQNGKVERFNRTLATEWAYNQPFTNNTQRREALAPWLEHYNTERAHQALKGLPPTSRLSPT